jgi:regulator-associated protein of mTOR
MTAMVVHDFHSLVAVATPMQFPKIYNLEGEMLDHYKGKVNFVGEPFGPTSCLGFHQFDPLLASGSLEKIVTVCRGEAKGQPTGHRL